jgi:hypothetical protein
MAWFDEPKRRSGRLKSDPVIAMVETALAGLEEVARETDAANAALLSEMSERGEQVRNSGMYESLYQDDGSPETSIAISDVIASGRWLVGTTEIDSETVGFVMRVTRFDEHDPDEFETLDPVAPEGQLRLLHLYIASLGRRAVRASSIRDTIILVDPAGDEYEPLRVLYDLDRPSGVFRFGIHADSPLFPKVFATGAIPYRLPPGDDEYRIAIQDGTIRFGETSESGEEDAGL